MPKRVKNQKTSIILNDYFRKPTWGMQGKFLVRRPFDHHPSNARCRQKHAMAQISRVAILQNGVCKKDSFEHDPKRALEVVSLVVTDFCTHHRPGMKTSAVLLKIFFWW